MSIRISRSNLKTCWSTFPTLTTATRSARKRRSERFTRQFTAQFFYGLSNNILQALVSVYQKILEFYQAICEILTRRGAKLIVKMVLESDRLPNIVQDFLRCSSILHNLVQTTTLRVLQDVHNMIVEDQSTFLHYLPGIHDPNLSQFADG